MAFNFGKLAGNFIQGYDTTAQQQQALMEAKQKDAAQMYSGRMMALLNQQLASAPQGMTSLSTGGAPSPAMPQQGGVSPPAGGMSAPAVGASGGAAGPSSPMGGAPNPQTRAVQQLGQGNAPQVPPSAVQQYSQQQGGPSSPLMSALSDPGMAQAVRLAQQAGVPPDMYGLVIPQFVGQFRPQANNAVKIDLRNNELEDVDKNKALDRQARMELQDKILAGRKQVAALEQRNGGLRNDPIYQALKQKAAVAEDQVKVTMGSDDALAAAAKANDDLMAYAKQLASGGGKQPSPQSAPAAPTSNTPTGTAVDAVTGAGAGDGSQENPIIVQTQSDIATAKSGTWLKVDGQLYQKP